MTDKELRMGYIGWSPDFREYKDIKVRKTVVGRVVTKQEWEAALTTAYREGVEALRDGLRKEAVADRIGRSIGLELAEAIAIRLLKGKP